MNSKKQLLCAAVALAVASFALPAFAADDELTWHGITLYGTYDIGLVHQTHGVPRTPDWGVGMAYLIAKNSNKSITTLGPNGLSQSKIAVRGKEPLNDSLAFVFNAEIGFNPQNGRLSDGPASLAYNNGRALTDQRSAGDSSRAGQLFNGPAFLGLSSNDLGTLTAGRHNSVLIDNIGRYDPMNQSYAFSVIGLSGTTSGGGYTQDSRYDNSLKYNWKHDMFRVAALYHFDGGHGSQGEAWQANLGLDWKEFSVDVVYASKDQGVSAAALSVAQAKTLPAGSLAATVSDNSSWTLDGSYTHGPFKVVAAYEHIEFDNPSEPLKAGFVGLGGYLFAVVNNTAFPRTKKLDVSWAGVKYLITKDLDITGAYYHYDQNAYGAKPCHDRSEATCSGELDAYSVRLDWRFAKRFDAYAGAMFSRVADGLASGYLHSSTIDPMIGLRFQF